MSQKLELTIKIVPEDDLRAFHEMRNNYGSGHETWADTLYHFEKWPDLSVAAYLSDPADIVRKGSWRTFPPEGLVGVAVGTPWDQSWDMIANPPTGDRAAKVLKSVLLDNICIDHRYWRKGFGSRLLGFFEEQVSRMGRKRVGVGAAENIDAFYLANGYRVVELSVSVERSKLPKDCESLGYEITSFQDLGWQVSLSIPAGKFEPERREEIKRAFKADQVNYCYEKEV
jgi:GNAT superfamily N-acetyltransferase